MKKIIKISTKETNYSIEIESNSILKNINNLILKNKKIIFLVDNKVFHIFKKVKNYKKHNLIVINCSEKIKSFESYKKITQKILKIGIDRNTVLVAIGGGTLGDLSGFIASTLLRGLDLVLFPTTLLSQVDSSIGGKNGINTSYGKNQIGTFYQPKIVFIDPGILSSLSKRELKSGFSEIIKHSLIYDERFFKWLEKNDQSILELNLHNLTKAIYKSVLIKKNYVLNDEKEKLSNINSRAILNFGHTFGHALETYYNFNKKLTHGEAISIGMTVASKLSNKLNHLSNKDYLKIINIFKKNKLPTIDKKMYDKKIFEIIKKDKKNINGEINFILLKKIGSAFIKPKLNINSISKIIN